jgi:hypothetical protein
MWNNVFRMMAWRIPNVDLKAEDYFKSELRHGKF